MANPSVEDELDRLARGVVPKQARFVVTGVYLCCVVLDVVAIFGLAVGPFRIARFACAIRPFGAISYPFFSDELIQYAAAQCAGTPSEPAISVILLSVKLALGILLIPTVCSFVIWRPGGLVALCKAFRAYAGDRETYLKELKRWMTRLAILIGVSLACVLLATERTVADFNTSIAHKLFLEDGMTLVVPATIFFALISLMMFSTGKLLAVDGE